MRISDWSSDVCSSDLYSIPRAFKRLIVASSTRAATDVCSRSARFLISAASPGFTDAARFRVLARLGRRRGKGTGRRGSSRLFVRAIGLEHKWLVWCRYKSVDTLNGCNVVARPETTSRVDFAVKTRIDKS